MDWNTMIFPLGWVFMWGLQGQPSLCVEQGSSDCMAVGCKPLPQDCCGFGVSPRHIGQAQPEIPVGGHPGGAFDPRQLVGPERQVGLSRGRHGQSYPAGTPPSQWSWVPKAALLPSGCREVQGSPGWGMEWQGGL